MPKFTIGQTVHDGITGKAGKIIEVRASRRSLFTMYKLELEDGATLWTSKLKETDNDD